MKLQISSLVIGLTMLSLGATAQTTQADSLEKAKKFREENAAKADVYIVNKSLGKNLTEGTDSVQVKTAEVSKKSSRKTRKVSCSSKTSQKKNS